MSYVWKTHKIIQVIRFNANVSLSVPHFKFNVYFKIDTACVHLCNKNDFNLYRIYDIFTLCKCTWATLFFSFLHIIYDKIWSYYTKKIAASKHFIQLTLQRVYIYILNLKCCFVITECYYLIPSNVNESFQKETPNGTDIFIEKPFNYMDDVKASNWNKYSVLNFNPFSNSFSPSETYFFHSDQCFDSILTSF